MIAKQALRLWVQFLAQQKKKKGEREKFTFFISFPQMNERFVLLFSPPIHDCGRNRKMDVDLCVNSFIR
jgi:hypothetical protein